MRTHGITQIQYDLLYHRQRGKCAICFKQPKRLVVDHDHRTMQVRGLLCDGCNTGGLRLDTLLQALEYLKEDKYPFFYRELLPEELHHTRNDGNYDTPLTLLPSLDMKRIAKELG